MWVEVQPDCLKTVENWVAESEIRSGYTWVPAWNKLVLWGLWEPEVSTKGSWEWGNVGCPCSWVNNRMAVLYPPVSRQIKSGDLMPHRHKKCFVWEGQECRSPVALLGRSTHRYTPWKAVITVQALSPQEACASPLATKINTLVLMKKGMGWNVIR